MPKKIMKTEYIWQEVEQLFVTLYWPMTREQAIDDPGAKIILKWKF